MKKTYIIPNLIAYNVVSENLLDASASGSYNLSEENATVSGGSVSMESKGGYWDDEDEDY